MESHPNASSKTDRKTVERNRRNHMKNLYSELNSLIPNHSSKETMSLPDQLNEAANYIKKLQRKLERMKEKKENLMGINKLSRSISSGMMVGVKSPHIEIHDMGSALHVVLTSGLDQQFMFYEVVRLLHEEGAQIVNANFSIIDDMIFHTVHSEIGESMHGFGAARISRRLKKFVSEFVNAS
ncbi:PREDICTED: transcription factor bHLH36-like [Nelumbo nucifera]|uniref:Transcription factor bHLH36-like n=2 Tax=Nelumbo nucifera TaxID=4432 RepID=A0A1U8A5P9_NELNU|nr:PREDICTED: transcription factor bHLH36-like [Nelumbo nucifera]DAD22862.1 TPA_asm: hypothetical protein HUJ06_024325 [Nelumbo nucifera]